MTVKMLALVLPLGLDTFAICTARALSGLSPRRQLRMSLGLAGFEAVMPLVGLAIGRPLGSTIGSAADYVVVVVLLALAIHVLVGDDDESELGSLLERGGMASVALGIAVSLDELAIGFAFGLLHLPVGPVIALIAVQALLVSQLGMRLGARLGKRVRERAERLSGAALALLAIGLLIAKLIG